MKKIYLGFFVLICLIFSNCSKKNIENDEIIFGCFLDVRYTYFDENKNLTGYSIELSKLIANKMNKKPKFVIMDYIKLFPSIEKVVIDIIVDLEKTDQLSNKILLSRPYSSESFYMIVDEKYKNINSIDDVVKNKLVIGASIGSIEERFLNKFYKNSKIVSFDDEITRFQAYKKNIIDVFFDSKAVLNHFVDKYRILNSKLIKINKNIMPFEMYFGFNKKNFILRDDVNLALIELERNGDIFKLKKKYNIDDE
jgi:cystine transport system substrate-binding protein